MIVGVEIRLLDRSGGVASGLGKGLELLGRVEIVVTVLRLLVRPPLRGVSAVKPQIEKRSYVWLQVLTYGCLELGFVNLRPRRVERFEQAKRGPRVIGAA